MKMPFRICKNPVSILVVCCLLTCNGFAQETAIPPREKFQLFLLVGQSNMAGRGIVESQDKQPHPRVLMLDKNRKWVRATDPMHFDKAAAGVGLGKTFGQIIADAEPGITVGLIPCAVGGSPIDAWQPGALYSPTMSHPWDDAIERTEIALKSGTLRGILWHQGESDSNPELADAYERKLHDLVACFRAKFNAPSIPFVVGQMGKFNDGPWDEFRQKVDAAHRALPEKVVNTAFVSAEGLQHKGDKVHFDAASCRELGKRYAIAYQELQLKANAAVGTDSKTR